MNAPARIKQRAALLEQLRAFFARCAFTEVHTPRVDDEIIPELHIDPFEVPGLGFLQASPEMHMKRLLCAGSGPIFEVARCFRQGERGKLHCPEFTMIEWYRPGDDMHAGIALLDELVQHLLACSPSRQTSYREAFQRTLDINPHTAPIEALQRYPGHQLDDRDELLNLLLAAEIEPTLGVDVPEIVYHFPASQSALATTKSDANGNQVAERFELYYRGVELANGYHELTDAVELRERLTSVNEQRIEHGRSTLPLPEKLLTAMERPGLPPCAGVALGFDRLMMLVVGAESIAEVVV